MDSKYKEKDTVDDIDQLAERVARRLMQEDFV